MKYVVSMAMALGISACATPAQKLGLQRHEVVQIGNCFTSLEGAYFLEQAYHAQLQLFRFQAGEKAIELAESIEQLCLRADEFYGNRNGVAGTSEAFRVMRMYE